MQIVSVDALGAGIKRQTFFELQEEARRGAAAAAAAPGASA